MHTTCVSTSRHIRAISPRKPENVDPELMTNARAPRLMRFSLLSWIATKYAEMICVTNN